jgi:hypothetical protein
MNTLRRLGIVIVVAGSTMCGVIGALLLFLVLGPAGLVAGAGVVAGATLLGLRMAKGLEVPGQSPSRVAVIGCVWASVALAVVGFPMVGVPLTEGDAIGGAMMIGLPLMVVLGAALGVFWPSRTGLSGAGRKRGPTTG